LVVVASGDDLGRVAIGVCRDWFVYLEHGAHYAIGALAVIMLLATVHIEVPEIVTGLIGIAFIVWAVINSISYRKREAALAKH
jgi:uncharacterized protein